jgi:topoisomerase-4 subunit B
VELLLPERGLVITLNGKRYVSKKRLARPVKQENQRDEIRYPVIHLKGEDIEVAITHESQYGEEYYSFVNGQFTTQGGTHLAAFREAFVKTVRDFFKKDYDTGDVRASICAAISIRGKNRIWKARQKRSWQPDCLRQRSNGKKRYRRLSIKRTQ